MTGYLARVSAARRSPRAQPPLAHRSVVSLLRTVDVVRRFLAGVVEPQGITLQQFNVLRILRGAERAGEAKGLPTLELAERMVERAPGITRLLDRLEAKALVRRERCPHDRRQVLCHITPAGLRLLDRLERPMREADAASLGMLDGRGQRALLALLETIQAGHQETSGTKERQAPRKKGER
jgi:DNA-binding MarR family transcriptional regulator